MANTPEGRVKAKIKKYLKTLDGCWFYCPIGGAYSTHGTPDIMGIYRGVGFGIEVKAPGRENTLTALQDDAINSISAAGGIAFVASHVETVMKVFEGGAFGPDIRVPQLGVRVPQEPARCDQPRQTDQRRQSRAA